MIDCPHTRVVPDVCDQTLGVACLDCRKLLAWCWQENHVPEPLWNRACENDKDAVPTTPARESHCAICRQRFQ